MVQLRNKPRFHIRPHPALRDSRPAQRIAFGLQLIGVAFLVAWAALAVFVVSSNPELAGALLGHHRAIPIITEIALALHACFFLWAAYCISARLCYGVLQPPAIAYASVIPQRICIGIGCGLLVMSVTLPLGSCNGDNLCFFESYSNFMVSLLVQAMFGLHGLYTGQVTATMWGVREHTHVRYITYLVTTALMAAVFIGYLRSIILPQSILIYSYGIGLPLPILLTYSIGGVCAITCPAVAIMAEVRYTGRSKFGFEPPDDLPLNQRKSPFWGFTLLLTSMLLASSAASLLVTGGTLMRVESRYGADLTGYDMYTSRQQVHINNAEECHLVWGVKELVFPDSDGHSASDTIADPTPIGIDLIEGFQPEPPTAQTHLLNVCLELKRLTTPTSSGIRFGGRGAPVHTDQGPIKCVVGELDDWLRTHGTQHNLPGAVPVNEGEFARAMVLLLRDRPELQSLVGFTDTNLTAVGWIKIDLKSQHAYRGSQAVEYALDPGFLKHERRRWDAWFRTLGQPAGQQNVFSPALGGYGYGGLGGLDLDGIHEGASKQEQASASVPPDTITRYGWHDCPKWGILATENAFLDGVTRACIATPLFTMFAILIAIRSVAVAYLVLLTLLSMILTTLGLLRALHIPLGAVEALALSLVMGVSVDYIIHLAYAYVNTMALHRRHKSRAALFARSGSVTAAAATTLLAVFPMLIAHMRPLRQVGAIVGIVTGVSLLFALLFFVACLMLTGPKRTRERPRGIRHRRRRHMRLCRQGLLAVPMVVGGLATIACAWR